MNKQRIVNSRVGEEYFEIKHDSGLTILCYPMEQFCSSYALFGTKYGSIDRAFRTDPNGDFRIVPDGIAHYLEHKLFESEEGDAFGLFSKYGASANAYTSFDRTAYLFSCTDHFEECLRALLGFVQSPYFTKENVEKERGIIGQEIRMYDDDPSWQVFFQLLTALYQNHPVRVDIAGTVESIAEITPELLYDCYHTFYSLDQMTLAVAGNFSVDTVMQVVDELCKPQSPKFLERQSIDEPDSICTDRVTQQLDVALPMFQIGWKEVSLSGKEGLAAEIDALMLMQSMFGEATSLYRGLRDDGLITDTLDWDITRGNGYFVNIIGGESKDPDEVLCRVKAEVEAFQQQGIDEETFRRVQRSMYGRAVRSLSNVPDMAQSLLTASFSDTGLFDRIELIASATVEGVNERLQQMFQPDKLALSVVSPK